MTAARIDRRNAARSARVAWSSSSARSNSAMAARIRLIRSRPALVRTMASASRLVARLHALGCPCEFGDFLIDDGAELSQPSLLLCVVSREVPQFQLGSRQLATSDREWVEVSQVAGEQEAALACLSPPLE